MSTPRPLTVTDHALDRYRQHAPDAQYEDVRRACRGGVGIDVETANRLSGRTKNPDGTTVYVLSPARLGLFVVVSPEPKRDLIITYLRFGLPQAQFARDHWPDTTPIGWPKPAACSPRPVLHEDRGLVHTPSPFVEDRMTTRPLRRPAVVQEHSGIFAAQVAAEPRVAAFLGGPAEAARRIVAAIPTQDGEGAWVVEVMGQRVRLVREGAVWRARVAP